MNAVGTLSAAPFSGLDCFERDNPEGFSFEVPACECSAGTRLRYVARLEAADADIHYEIETNFLNGDPSDDVRMVSHRPDRIERLFVGDRELPRDASASALDLEQWALAEDTWTSMLRNYEPVLHRAFRTCTEDRLERELSALR